MGQTTVRVESIEIANFKNVSFGKLVLENTKPEYRASILGLYGQNGSGKTALIDALELLKLVLSGQSIPSFFADYINVDSVFATLKYGFKVEDSSKKNIYHVFYEVCLRKDINDSEYNTKEIVANPSHKVTLFDEVLSYSCEANGQKSRLSPIIDTISLLVERKRLQPILLLLSNLPVKLHALLSFPNHSLTKFVKTARMIAANF